MAACNKPFVNAIGHLSGRLMGKRKKHIPMNLKRLFERQEEAELLWKSIHNRIYDWVSMSLDQLMSILESSPAGLISEKAEEKFLNHGHNHLCTPL